MYDPDLTNVLKQFEEAMPGLMNAVGMSGSAATLTGFLSTYLYGMLLLMFPMVFIILRAHGLIAKYVDRGSMVALVSAPVKRRTVAFTQMKVLATGIFALIIYITILEIAIAEVSFPGELEIGNLLLLNAGLLCLHLFIGGICFLASCLFSEGKYSIGFGAGIPALMFVLQMLANTGGNAENAKYFTFFSLFNPDGLLTGETSAIAGILLLLAGAIVLFTASIAIFCKKDLHI
jgi:ABC-2 type transport system permease protein